MICSYCRPFCRHCRLDKSFLTCLVVNDDSIYVIFKCRPIDRHLKKQYMYRICSDERKRCRRSGFPKQRYIVSPINRPYCVGWGVQPKMPIYIFKIEHHGGVPLRFHLQSSGGTQHMIGFQCVQFSFLCDFQRYKYSSFVLFSNIAPTLYFLNTILVFNNNF